MQSRSLLTSRSTVTSTHRSCLASSPLPRPRSHSQSPFSTLTFIFSLASTKLRKRPSPFLLLLLLLLLLSRHSTQHVDTRRFSTTTAFALSLIHTLNNELRTRESLAAAQHSAAHRLVRLRPRLRQRGAQARFRRSTSTDRQSGRQENGDRVAHAIRRARPQRSHVSKSSEIDPLTHLYLLSRIVGPHPSRRRRHPKGGQRESHARAGRESRHPQELLRRVQTRTRRVSTAARRDRQKQRLQLAATHR